MAFIQTYTGARFDFRDIAANYPRIEDIAHALANQCRFNGHTVEHYSVAEHSVRVAILVGDDMIKACPADEESHPDEVIRARLFALLHDAAEAYTGDIVAPLKALLGDPFGIIEAQITELIEVAFRLDPSEAVRDAVKLADKVLLATEVRDLYVDGSRSDWPTLPTPLSTRIIPWSAAKAERIFLNWFELWKSC